MSKGNTPHFAQNLSGVVVLA